MATSAPVRKKSAKADFLESFSRLVKNASEHMTHEQFTKAAQKANASLDRALATPRKKSESA